MAFNYYARSKFIQIENFVTATHEKEVILGYHHYMQKMGKIDVFNTWQLSQSQRTLDQQIFCGR